MRGKRGLQGTLESFLDTYVSRYSEYDGYWLFGFLVPELTILRVDLLLPPLGSQPHFRRAIDLASAKFSEQAGKWKVDLAMLQLAVLTLSRNEPAVAYVNGHSTDAWRVRVAVDVEIRGGRQCTAERIILVAPHNPTAEIRSRTARERDGP
jgi:hypothetical protein